MTEPTLSHSAPPRLHDPWERRGPIPLDGVLERHQFAPLLMAFAGLIIAFVLFQVGFLLIAPLVLVLKGATVSEILPRIVGFMEESAETIIVVNSIGLILCIGLPAILLARWHSSRLWAFLRVRRTDLPFLLLSVFGLFALIPVVQWLGAINQKIPLPDFLQSLDQTQIELIAKVMESNLGIVFSLAMLAIIPAICEELLFRGYVQRQAQRGFGIAGSILFSGILFGLYHIRLTQVLPLSALGIYMAYVAWRTGSLWIPIVVHFANNALAVALGVYVSANPELDLGDIEQLDIPWYAVVIGALFFGAAVYAMHRHAVAQLAKAPASALDDAVSPEHPTSAHLTTEPALSESDTSRFTQR